MWLLALQQAAYKCPLTAGKIYHVSEGVVQRISELSASDLERISECSRSIPRTELTPESLDLLLTANESMLPLIELKEQKSFASTRQS